MKLKLNLRKNLIILLMLIPLVLFAYLMSLSNPKLVKADADDDYVEKIVAVVYDDSGSMRGDKFNYAKYAMKVLMASLDSRDTLKVFQINKYQYYSSYGSYIGVDFDVDLQRDRQAEISDKIQKLTAYGPSTPATKIKNALEWMSGYGLNDVTTVDGKEFKLIIITDGVYDEVYYGQYSNTSTLITNMISGYKGLQTSFFGIGLTNDKYKVNSSTSVTPYYANSATDVVGKMKEITTSTAGRYALNINCQGKNEVEVDLSQCGFSVKSVAVLAQSNSKSVNLTNYSCTTPLISSRGCELKSDNGNLFGYSMLLSPDVANDAPKYLSNEKITLKFANAPTDLLILVEPAIKMESTILYEDAQGQWKEISEIEISSNLSPGQKVKIDYKLLDAGTNTDVTSNFTNVEVKTLYIRGGQKTTYDNTPPITLEEGRGEIALDVTLNIGGSKLELYDSWACDIDSDPSAYSITPYVTKNGNQVTIDYQIIYGYENVFKNQLEGSGKIYTWTVTKKDTNGNSVPLQSTVKNNGYISVTFNMDNGNYGDYVVDFQIIREEDGIKKHRGNVTTVTKDIEDLGLSVNTNKITLSSYDLEDNTNAFTFTLKDAKYNEALNFNSNLVGYSFTSGNLDLTNSVYVKDNKLTFTPNASIHNQLKNIGTHNLTLKVWSAKDPTNVYETTTVKLIINKTNVTVVTSKTDNLNGDDTKVKFDYTVYRDNKLVSQSDLTGTNAVFKITSAKVLDPSGKEVTFDTNISGGTISLIFNKQIGNYGVYKSQITVEKIGDNNPVTASVSLDYYISNLIITNGDISEITLNPYQIDKNTKAFEFSVTDKGHPINFNSGFIGYTLKIGGVDVTNSATLSNNKLTFVPNDKLPNSLHNVNNYNVTLSVWSVQNKSISSSSTLKLNVVNAPEFKVVATKTDGVNGNHYKAKFDYTVYYNGKVVSQSDLTGTSPKFSYQVIEFIDPSGNNVNYTSSVIGGTISLAFDKTAGNYGVYKAKIKVTENYDGRTIESSINLDYYISDLIITNGVNTEITLNTYEIDRNAKAFEFSVTDKGHAINLNSGLIGYTLKIGGVDVTSKSNIDGNKISYMPGADLPTQLKNIANYNVVLDVWSYQNTSIKEQSILKLSIVKAPELKVVASTTEGVNGNENKVKIDYTVYYDGKIVSESDLKGSNPIFSYNLLEMVDPSANRLEFEESITGGTISIIFDKTEGLYGVYKSKIKVTKVDYNQTVNSNVDVSYYISDLIIENGDNKVIELNEYQIKSNQKAFEFTVFDKTYPLNFDLGLIGYTLKIGGVDVTKSATIQGNKIIFVPNSKLPANLQSVNDYNVVLDVWSYQNTSIKEQSVLKLKIVKAPEFYIVPTTTEMVNGDDMKVKIDYAIYYAGNLISENDLTGTDAIFSFEILETVAPNGNSINPICSTTGGVISLIFNKTEGVYGTYKSKISVTKIDYNQTITSSVDVNHVITKLNVTNGDNKQLVFNLYELQRNDKAFEFIIDDNGYPINFNSNLIGYTLKMGGVDVTNNVTLQNNKLTYIPNSLLPSNLQKVANYDVVLDVWSKNSNEKAQSILKLNIIKAPNFDIVTNTTMGVDGDDNKIKVDYTVFYDDKIVSESDLNGNNPIFSWDIVSIKDPKGKDLTPFSSVSGGTISVVFSKEKGNYGSYKVTVNVTKIDDNRPITKEVEYEYSISNIVITKPDDNDLSLDNYQLNVNQKAFEFTVTDDGYPINFDSGLIGYTLKIGGVDVTKDAIIKDNTLKYVPNSKLPTKLQSIADYAVILEVWSIRNTGIKQSSASKLSIVKAPNFKITTKTTMGDNNKITVDYTVYYDDKEVSETDLKDGANQVFKIAKVEFSFTEVKNFTPQYDININGGTISVIFDKIADKFGVYTAKITVVQIDVNREIESQVEMECFLTDLKIKKGENNDISLTTYQLRKNNNAFEFTLTNEDRPVNFTSDLLGYTLTIDGLDVTSLVAIEQNVLRFIPNLQTLPTSLQDVKEKDVVLEVWSTKNPSVNAKAISKFNLIESIYEVKVVNSQDTSVDIYDLKNCKAKIYYKISVDGHDFSKQELIDGLDEGLIEIDTSPFGWLLLLPASVDTALVSENGSELICLSVSTKWPSPLDNLFASFIFTGDKILTVKCGNGVGEGIISLMHVEFLSRLWRWLVIIAILYFIIHTLLWILGFFIAKRLPKGVLVQIKLNPNNPKFLISTSSEVINTEKKKIILWHLKRYIPFKVFLDQAPVTRYGVTLQVLDRQPVMVHNKLRTIVKLELDDDEPSDLIRKWRRRWQEYDGGSRPSLKITTKILSKLIDDTGKEIRPNTVEGISENYFYATKNLKGRIDTIIFFKYID